MRLEEEIREKRLEWEKWKQRSKELEQQRLQREKEKGVQQREKDKRERSRSWRRESEPDWNRTTTVTSPKPNADTPMRRSNSPNWSKETGRDTRRDSSPPGSPYRRTGTGAPGSPRQSLKMNPDGSYSPWRKYTWRTSDGNSKLKKWKSIEDREAPRMEPKDRSRIYYGDLSNEPKEKLKEFEKKVKTGLNLLYEQIKAAEKIGDDKKLKMAKEKLIGFITALVMMVESQTASQDDMAPGEWNPLQKLQKLGVVFEQLGRVLIWRIENLTAGLEGV